MSTKDKAANRAAVKDQLHFRADAHEEFADELQRVTEWLPLAEGLSSPSRRVVAALRMLRASGKDTAAMASRFDRRATFIFGPAPNEPLKGISRANLLWWAAEYSTFAEEILWLIRRALQCATGGHSTDWRLLPRPRYGVWFGLGLGDVCLVETARLSAELAHPSTGWGDELVTLGATVRGLLERHREIASKSRRLAAQIRSGRPPRRSASGKDDPPKSERVKPLTGRALVEAILLERDQDPTFTRTRKPTGGSKRSIPQVARRAMRRVAEKLVQASGQRRGTPFLDETCKAAVEREVRRMQRDLSRWRLKVPTYVKQRAAPPSPARARKQSRELAGVLGAWGAHDEPDSEESSNT